MEWKNENAFIIFKSTTGLSLIELVDRIVSSVSMSFFVARVICC